MTSALLIAMALIVTILLGVSATLALIAFRARQDRRAARTANPLRGAWRWRR